MRPDTDVCTAVRSGCWAPRCQRRRCSRPGSLVARNEVAAASAAAQRHAARQQVRLIMMP
jgi:hypothetical protein